MRNKRIYLFVVLMLLFTTVHPVSGSITKGPVTRHTFYGVWTDEYSLNFTFEFSVSDVKAVELSFIQKESTAGEGEILDTINLPVGENKTALRGGKVICSITWNGCTLSGWIVLNPDDTAVIFMGNRELYHEAVFTFLTDSYGEVEFSTGYNTLRKPADGLKPFAFASESNRVADFITLTAGGVGAVALIVLVFGYMNPTTDLEKSRGYREDFIRLAVGLVIIFSARVIAGVVQYVGFG